MKNWKVTAKLFMTAGRYESVTVRCNTARKAETLAKNEFTKKYPNILGMIDIAKVEEVEE